MSLKDRALAAVRLEREAEEALLQKQISIHRMRATDAILRAGERFGIDIDPTAIVGENEKHPNEYKYSYEEKVTEDATLKFRWPAPAEQAGDVDVVVVPPVQLYWDLPPGQEERGPGGGTFGCYGLRRMEVSSLVSLGKCLERIELARAQWRRKHGVKTNEGGSK